MLKTVISGWLCKGITAVAGRKKRHNCTQENNQRKRQQLKAENGKFNLMNETISKDIRAESAKNIQVFSCACAVYKF